MGCHLYICRIDTDHEETIPFLRIRLLDGYQIHSKKLLKNLLWAEHLSSLAAIDLNEQLIGNIRIGDCNSLAVAQNKHWYYPNSSTKNVGFEDLRKNMSDDDAVIEMLKWDIDRIKNGMWTEELINEVLDKFKEGIHYAITG
jgi:hypothetical protein